MKPTSFALSLSVIALSACSLFGGSATVDDGSSSSAMSSTSSLAETQNVSYEGMLQPMGVSIFMEGTHKLVLDDGRFILLESASGIDLTVYENKRVQVLGAVRPTVEAGGMIMRVQQVAVFDVESSSMSSASESSASKIFCGGIAAFKCPDGMDCVDDPSDSCDPAHGGADCGGMCVPGKSSSSVPSSIAPVVSSKSSSSSVKSSSVSSVSSASSVSSSNWQASTELTDKAAVMSKDKMDASFWTQQYCTKTAAFCIPIHKNWYYTSFGASAGALWYVEVGPQAVNNIGDGPLTINLMSGTSASAGGSDGQVSANGSGVVGYKEWTNGRHFELRGPASLQAAITYMLAHLTAN